MTVVEGDQYTVTYVQGNRNLMPQIMKLLSDHIIIGAAHDDSARVPPPRCHPGTRIKLIARITTWFNDEARPELLLWITGPAGVGKSAVVQTFAEYLVEAKLLGASIFCSRPNKRNNPYRIFITIAYQVAVRIGEYREFIIERLSLDPQLLNRDMATQFKTFIFEPFVEKKIGAGGKRWGILLDGLDELEGEDAQCDIIRLISTFAHEHRDAPLVWIIASRPEPHICNTFNDAADLSHWSEYIPIDSTEACNDVERFLRSSFAMTRRRFRQCVPRDWPSDIEFLKLTAAASGLFVYAEVVMQFIRDPDNADPVSQFDIVLLVIDRSGAIPTKENPFVQLDALYHEIMSSISPKLWPTTKRLLGLLIYIGNPSSYAPVQLGTPRGISILFGLTRHVIYACLLKCHSTVRVPGWKVAHKEKLTILHASFADYLKDSSRSGEFHVGDKHAKEDMLCSLLGVWNMCSGDNINTASVESTWHRYCLKLDDKTLSRAITKFHATLFYDMVFCLRQWIWVLMRLPTEAPTLRAQLHQVHMIKLCYYFDAYNLRDFVDALVNHKSGANAIGLLREVQLKELHLGHLDWKDMSPAHVRHGKGSKTSKGSEFILHRPRSSAVLKTFISELESIQERSSEIKVIIFGGIPEGRVAAFCLSLTSEPGDSKSEDFTYYVIPYPQEV
ncbi:hypothetical protein AGABI1DRAFT_109006 [Agaricus bisporus var. burnettii JB137-S8]|uniref:Nephrocystin 3-like N-terminal domain-containing protein n=1 Tax=Agaricus bisporus var. burnettii (strain JB137-S8 / ATCC MYA-4627 / FGSC 10392) TaxID=597362 RepID=K5WZR3_AGABU|nr:uncharacterized protein AGABI1DRAFT_109006 [Agaricus bisporus var. burnettii JB137-S8]EKM76077.1 hypothetical protein AGABI1DRAFT_109006 [Agaricus bisporus var. burnettii JB137-S8]